MYPGLITVTSMSYCSTSARRQSKKAWVACLEAASEKQGEDCALRRRAEGRLAPLDEFFTAMQPLFSARTQQLVSSFQLWGFL